MNKALCCVLAMAALAASVDTFDLYDHTEINDYEIPDKGEVHAVIKITADDIAAAKADFQIKFWVDFTDLETDFRQIGLQLKTSYFAKRLVYTFKNSAQKYYTFNFTDMWNPTSQCTGPCDIDVVLNATCGRTCINDLTTDFGFKLLNKTGDKVYSTDVAPYVVLHDDAATEKFDVDNAEYAYFTYKPQPTRLTVPVAIDTDFWSSLALIGDSEKLPNIGNRPEWVQLSPIENHTFVATKPTYIAVLGKSVSGSASFRLCVGPNCSAAPALAASFLVVLAAVIRMLL